MRHRIYLSNLTTFNPYPDLASDFLVCRWHRLFLLWVLRWRRGLKPEWQSPEPPLQLEHVGVLGVLLWHVLL